MYIKLTNDIPAKYTLDQLRRDNSNTSFPKHIPDLILASYNVYPYYTLEKPVYDVLTQSCTETPPHQDASGVWYISWVVENKTQDEAEGRIRQKRDHLLQGCDWVVTKSSELGTPVPAAWLQYRQDLRDLPSQAGFPYSVEWPTLPQ
jgi:hypothetical protein